MRFSAFTIPLLTAIAATAQSPYPACATPCLTSANTTGCVSSDTHCLCTNSAFVSSTTTCIYSACNGTDLQTALQTARDICAAVGVTLTSTPAGSATASSVSPSSTATKSAASRSNYNVVVGLGASLVAAVAALSM